MSLGGGAYGVIGGGVLKPRVVVSTAAITLTDSQETTTNGTVLTFADVDIGAEAADRVLLIAVYRAFGNVTPSSAALTVDGPGNNATLVASQVSGTTNKSQVELWTYELASGTTADIASGNSQVSARTMIHVMRMTGVNATVSDTASDTVSVLNGTVDIPAGGIVVAAATDGVGGVTATFSGVTERFDSTFESQLYALAFDTGHAGGSTALSCTLSSSSDRDAAVFAAFAPS